MKNRVEGSSIQPYLWILYTRWAFQQ